MKKYIAGTIAALGLIVGISSCQSKSAWVVEAQSLPYNMQVTWPANPAGDNVVSYLLSVDGGTAVTVPASACTPQCVGVVPVLSAGSHTLSQVSQNQLLSSGVPVTVVLQNSLPTTTPFTVNLSPGKPSGPASLK